jgi:hypothetical protein
MRLRKLPPIEISAGQWHRIFRKRAELAPRQRALVMRRMREIAERS